MALNQKEVETLLWSINQYFEERLWGGDPDEEDMVFHQRTKELKERVTSAEENEEITLSPAEAETLQWLSEKCFEHFGENDTPEEINELKQLCEKVTS